MNIFRRLYYILDFLAIYAVQLVRSNILIAYDILTPEMNTNPGFIRVPLTLKSEFGMLLFSNLLSMTPGTLVTDITENRKFILVHVLYLKTEDEDEILAEIKKIQEKIRRITE